MVPWWNEECSRAVKERNKAFRTLKKNLSCENVVDYQRKRAVARRTIKYKRKKLERILFHHRQRSRVRGCMVYVQENEWEKDVG